jgi:hypothetical protein
MSKVITYAGLSKGYIIDEPKFKMFDDVLVIQTRGCGCCSEDELLTPALLEEAIKDAEEWLASLKAIDASKLPKNKGELCT